MGDKKKALSVGDLVGLLGKAAPFDTAESWDNVGLLAGDATENVRGVVVAVNLGPETLEQAKVESANVIVCHHPPIFKPISKLTRASHPYLYEAIKNGFSVVALHTNFDLASEDLSRRLAEKLGYEFSDFLAPRGGDSEGARPLSNRLGKFVTYVPEKDVEVVRQAVCDAGAGQIGTPLSPSGGSRYTDCSFSWMGEGTFKGGPGSNPAIGKPGVLERVAERRLEVVFPWKQLEKVVRAAKRAHPYEEMAYDVYEMSISARQLGYGFVGIARDDKSDSLAFPKFLSNVKKTFQLKEVTVVGSGLLIRRMAFSPGSGSGFIGKAAAKGVDAYVCGEVGYHQMLEARQKGVTLVILGHSYSERFFVETVAGWCQNWFKDLSQPLSVQKVFEKIHEIV